jgi:alkylhydroperoxidase family enzyme
MTSRTRVPHARISGILGAMVRRFSIRMLGQVPEPLSVMWHNPRVFMGFMGFSRKASRWKACDPQLKSFAHMASASVVGCSFCLDLGYFQAHNDKLDIEKARQVPRWRSSNVFTPLERDVMEYAEAMSRTPPEVTDELSSRLLQQLGAPALIELTAFVGAANMVSRSNVALGIKGQGFSEACGLAPLAERVSV